MSTSPFQTLTPAQQVADTISECTQIMISLEQFTSDATLTDTLESVFQNAVNEYNYGQNIGSVGLSTALQAVTATTNTATSEKDSWEAEAVSAASLTIAASAAQVAAAVFSWAPGLNLCIDGAAIAAYVAAQVLENEAETAENTVINYISNFNNEVLAQSGMTVIQNWNTAIQNNILNFKKLSLGATDQQIQATLMAITNYLLEQKQDLTVANYGNVIYNVALTITNNPTIDAAWRNAMVAIANNPTPEEIKNQADDLGAQFPAAWSITVMVMNVYTSIMATLDFKTWQAVRRTFSANFIDTGDVASAQELTDTDPQIVRLGKWASRLKAFGVIVNIAVGVMSIIAIVDTVKAAAQMSDAIQKASDGMNQYLTELLDSEGAQQGAITGQT